MSTVTTHPILRFLSMTWLTGPIFAKELRAVSRQRRHFLLRFGYMVLLTAFIVGTWLVAVESKVSTAATVYEMADAGKAVVVTIGWFQFLAIQLVAVSLLSTSISEEIRRRTLSVLMTTPITCLQIVGGKLLSKLLQLTILLLMSLPALAIVRVFGGVPWEFVVGSVCITLTAAMLAGAMAMLYSTMFRRAYASILLTLATGFVVYQVLPLIFGLFIAVFSRFLGMGEFALGVFLHTNPFVAMFAMTMSVFEPGFSGSVFFAWPLHCLFMLALTAGLLAACTAMVRRAARKAIGGRSIAPETSTVVLQSGVTAISASGGKAPAGLAVGASQLAAAQLPVATVGSPGEQARPILPGRQTAVTPPPIPAVVASQIARAVPVAAGTIRRITGSPVIWRKLRTPMIAGKVLRIVALCIVLLLAISTYWLIGALGALDDPGVQVGYVSVYLIMAMITTAVFAATSIASEKESRSLEMLLTTPLSDWHVLAAFVVETLRRSAPAWVLVAAHMLLFTVFLVIHPIGLLNVAMICAGACALLTGTGLYFSCRFRRPTQAVVMNLATAIGLWLILPSLLAMGGAYGGGHGTTAWLSTFNPVAQAASIVSGAAGDVPIEFDWPLGSMGPGGTTLAMLGSMLLHMAIGVFLLWQAKLKLRRKLF